MYRQYEWLFAGMLIGGGVVLAGMMVWGLVSSR